MERCAALGKDLLLIEPDLVQFAKALKACSWSCSADQVDMAFWDLLPVQLPGRGVSRLWPLHSQ